MPIIDRLTSEERAALERWNRETKLNDDDFCFYESHYEMMIDATMLTDALARLVKEDAK